MAARSRAGATRGAAAIAGIVCGGVVHLLFGATGAAALLLIWPALFNALLLAGGLCRLVGPGLLQARSVLLPDRQNVRLPTLVVFRRGLLTSLLNPKAYAFVLSVYPVFLRTNARPVFVQAMYLGAITAATQVLNLRCHGCNGCATQRRFATNTRCCSCGSRKRLALCCCWPPQ